MDAKKLYFEARQDYSLRELAKKLNLHTGTLKRWESQERIPGDYLIDLNSILGNKYKIQKENYRQNCEFFTKPSVAEFCVNSFLKSLEVWGIDNKEYTFIEPSVGNMAFYDLLPVGRKIGIDIEYKNNEIIQSNFLDYKPKENKKYILIGNPPFGLRGNLALRFINHASSFADFIAFILPPLFDSDGKGSPKKRVKDYELIHSAKLPLDSFIYPNKKSVDIATCFQIWAHKRLIENKTLNIEIQKPLSCKEYIKVYSLSDGGTPSSTRNKKMLHACDVYLPSTCFSSKTNVVMKAYDDFEKLPHRRGYGIKILKDNEKVKAALLSIEWQKESFLGTNSSLNLRTSIIENALIKKGFIDKGEQWIF